MDIRLLHGREMAPWLDELARLRITVFREFPYLYDGSAAYEADYLQTYVESPRSLCVLVLDADRVVGASTALPLTDETEEFMRPFRTAGWAPERICYFGESILLPEWRGQGLGVRFFEAREAHARQLEHVDRCAFCAVERPADHPLRPPDYRPLDEFWRRRGYRHHPELRTDYVWQDVDASRPSAKPLSFWMRKLP
ncbi:GNAT family N-acetyltransferase [Kushneria sinocarnis]|nr:GNAT family N-acetyltransferase [Kushneria sinocarnis]